jgi:hypothetical protein
MLRGFHAKPNGLDPEAYLREVIGRIADRPINRIAECYPGTSALHRRSPLQPDFCYQFSGRASGTSSASLVSE